MTEQRTARPSAPARIGRETRYPATPWAAARLYRPFILAAIAAGASGFVVGALLLLAAAGGGLSVSDLALAQVHGSVQLLGWCGLFVIGVATHVVPRFHGNAPLPFPWPQRVMLALVAGGLATRALAQPWDGLPLRGLLVAAGGIAVATGLALFAWSMALVLRRGTSEKRPVGHWLWLGALGAVACGLTYGGMSVDLATRLREPGVDLADPRWNAAFQAAAVYGFLLPFAFGVSARAVAGFLALPPRREVLDRAAWLLLGAGALLSVAAASAHLPRGVEVAGDVCLAGALLLFPLAMRVFERGRLSPVGAVYRWTGPYVRAAYAWLAVAGGLHAARAVEELGGPVLATGRVELHVLAVGFLSTLIVGFAQKALPLFERRPLPLAGALLPAFWLLQISTALRLLGSMDASAEVALRAASTLGLLGFALGAAPILALLALRLQAEGDRV